MRRFVTLAALLFISVPFGASLVGCHKAVAATFCNGQDSGVVLGQLTTLDLEPRLTGISLNQGEIGRVNAPTGKDCRGDSASATNVVYASTNIAIADVAPTTGALCGGSWNRNTGGAIPDFTVCTPTTVNGVAYVTTSANGVVSNPIAVFIHPVVTSIVLGPASLNCTTDPASDCIDLGQTSGFDTGAPVSNGITVYNGATCFSQGTTSQLVARSYSSNIVSQATNISNLVGPLQFSSTNAAVVTIDANGVATAAQPGSATITADISLASSTAGFFATCPPRSIVLSASPSLTAPSAAISVNQNTTQPLIATVTDTLGNPITNIQLEYISTSPTTIPTSGASVTPLYPGSAVITAICQPPACNPSPFNEIGLFGNGAPVTSNPVQIVSTGANFSTVLFIASTNSQYLLPVDFTTTTQLPPVRLPYVPNSMVISEDNSTIYMGNSYEIMSYSTASNAVVKQDPTVSGNVLAISDDNTTLVITDPVRQLIYLYLSGGGISTEYGGVASSAQFSTDSQTVYITTTDGRLLVHSTFTGWSSIPLTNLATDVAVTVPPAGVYLGGSPVDVRTNCPQTSVAGTGLSQTTTNVFYPDLGPVTVNAPLVAATNDGLHILGANTTALTDIKTNAKTGACPIAFTNAPNPPVPFVGVTAAVSTTGPYIYPYGITNVLTTSDSAFSFVTYNGTGGVIPQYVPATGALSNIKLQGTAIAPVIGVVSADNNTLYLGTTGDNLVHILTRGTGTFTDTTTPINPALPNVTGTGNATPNLLVQHPRKATS